MTSRLSILAFLLCSLLAADPCACFAEETGRSHSHDGVPDRYPEHPTAGDVAPDFSLSDTEGKPADLGEYLGRGYLVLAFGSASSAHFRETAPGLDALAKDWEKMEVRVLVVYTREAHPATLRGASPKTYKDRTSLARQTRKNLKVGLRFLVDGWDDAVHKAYGSMPDGAFLVDPKGVIVVRQVQSRVSTLDRELRRALKVSDPPVPRGG